MRVHATWQGLCPLLGEAFYVWVQGCPFRCDGCANERTLDFDGPAEELSVEALAGRFPGGALVLSGGEPFAHAADLAALVEQLRAGDPDLRVLAYSGFTLEQLVRLPRAEPLLRLLDVLVDGRYLEDEPSPHPLRGSRNQRVFLFGDRVAREELEGLASRPMVQVRFEGEMLELVGTGSSTHGMGDLLGILARRGLVLRA